MPRDPLPIHTAGGWLRRARSNLARAKQDKPDEVLFEDLCFDAQQAVELAEATVVWVEKTMDSDPLP